MGGRVGIAGALAILFLQGLTWATEPVAVLTEIRAGPGELRVRRAGEASWIAPQLLASLRPGDQIRALGNGRAVLVFSANGGTEVVSAANSPYTVRPPAAQTGTEKVRSLVASVADFLLGSQRELTYHSLSLRGPGRTTPFIISPRESRMLPGPVTFEWGGPDALQYRVRVVGPDGLLWEGAGLPRRPLLYPPEAPPLRAGARYVWELEAKGYPVEWTQFELLKGFEATRVQEALNLLQTGTPAAYPRNTSVLLRAGLLLQNRCYDAARHELLAGIKADQDEPTLHLLLGRVYERTGLKELAAEAFQDAQSRLNRTP